MEREVLWRTRRTSSGRCASCCRITRACGRPGCSGSASSFTTISAAASCCPPTRTLDLRSDPAGKPLKPLFTRAFEYSDCWVDDARLVVLNATDAADRGAVIRTRTEVVRRTPRRRRLGGRASQRRAERRDARRCGARLLVNAAGPWVDRRAAGAARRRTTPQVRLVKGSHIVVPKTLQHDARLHLPERRRPHRLRHSLRAGFHADRHHRPGLSGRPRASRDQRQRRSAISAARRASISPSRSRRDGRRVDLFRRAPALRRRRQRGAGGDARLRAEGRQAAAAAPLVNIFGGKITTYRRLAEAALEKIEGLLGAKGRPWTATARAAGRRFPGRPRSMPRSASSRAPTLSSTCACARRLVRAYGTRARTILLGARAIGGRSRATTSAPI